MFGKFSKKVLWLVPSLLAVENLAQKNECSSIDSATTNKLQQLTKESNINSIHLFCDSGDWKIVADPTSNWFSRSARSAVEELEDISLSNPKSKTERNNYYRKNRRRRPNYSRRTQYRNSDLEVSPQSDAAPSQNSVQGSCARYCDNKVRKYISAIQRLSAKQKNCLNKYDSMEINWQDAQRNYLDIKNQLPTIQRRLQSCEDNLYRAKNKAENIQDELNQSKYNLELCESEKEQNKEDNRYDLEAKEAACAYEKESLKLQYEDEDRFNKQEIASCKWDLQQIVDRNVELEDLIAQYAIIIREGTPELDDYN